VMSSEDAADRPDRAAVPRVRASAPASPPEAVDLGALVRDAGERARSLAGARGVAVEVEAPGSWTAIVDPAPAAAGPRQPRPQRGRGDARGRPGLPRRTPPRTGGHVVEVRDTGRGIEPDHLLRIFDLYFTTKADGTGVGLPVTQQIVTAHGGTIEVDSRPGAGTTMTVRLPRGEEAASG